MRNQNGSTRPLTPTAKAASRQVILNANEDRHTKSRHGRNRPNSDLAVFSTGKSYGMPSWKDVKRDLNVHPSAVSTVWNVGQGMVIHTNDIHDRSKRAEETK